MNPSSAHNHPHYFSSALPIQDQIQCLIKLAGALQAEHTQSKPALLLSKYDDQAKLESSNSFSYFMLYPTEHKCFTCPQALEHWHEQQSLAARNPLLTSKISFHSGWVGYYAYPSPASEPTANDSKPLAEFYYYPWAICLDHQTGQFHLLGHPDAAAQEVFAQLKQSLASCSSPLTASRDSNFSHHSSFSRHSRFSAGKFNPEWNKADYDDAFYKVQAYLNAGDCYQINLTHPHCAAYKGNPIEILAPLYDALNPSFGGYFSGQDCELVSVSPERFISIDQLGRIEAKPIKGTIKRSSNPEQDQYYIDELSNSAKNQAENLMIVDLLRNDLSMSAEPSSVQVEKLFELETHPNVHHLVSTISAQLKQSISPAQAISNAFPGGSITGAPKKRAMEIIAELEAQPRSLYCGSLGYYSDSGNADFNILIRSVEFRDQVMTCWGGGGITVDSDCDEEYEESLTKIRKIMQVIEAI